MNATIDRKTLWCDNNREKYREYQREYQRAHYETGSRTSDKKDYYTENKTRIVATRTFTKIALQFRQILL